MTRPTSKRTLISVAAAVSLVIAPAAAASAMEGERGPVSGVNAASVGGGLWQYGTTGTVIAGTVYSKYHHASKYHTATACDGAVFNSCEQSAAAAGKWANATKAKSPSGNTAYWNTF